MIATERHHIKGKAICPYCWGTNVIEIGKEGTDKHRHVCLDIRCVEITEELTRKRAENLK